ncbi:MAG: toprim domain-containing protein, partial [Enterococcus sp.]|nr:toprim domain-containing protein [Enterococcus sp.]
MNNDKACKKPTIKENIIVEGRDDTMAINRAVCAMTIETHGFGISNKTWNLIDRAYKANGIIIFTDPDFAGESIRKRILERYPDASQAFLTEKEAFLKGDIGIENASPEDIIEALKKVKSNGKDNNGKDKNPDLNTENHLKWTN